MYDQSIGNIEIMLNEIVKIAKIVPPKEIC